MPDFPKHFHMATEGLRSKNLFAIATLAVRFFDIEITVEERGGRGGGGTTRRKKDQEYVLTFHIRFKDSTVHKKYEHTIPANSVNIVVKMIEKFNALKLFVNSMLNKKSQTPINIKVGNLSLKKDGDPNL